jgi:hypothetical protein
MHSLNEKFHPGSTTAYGTGYPDFASPGIEGTTLISLSYQAIITMSCPKTPLEKIFVILLS